MSYLLEFPVAPLPENVHSPPYVLFGINGQNIAADLPPCIPLKVVTHFAPRLKKWLVSPPSTSQLPWATAKLALLTPHVAIDIISCDVEALAMRYIVTKMLLASGFANPKSLFLIQPSILESISIHKTWLAFELPLGGIQALHTHIESRLSHAPSVTLLEMVTIWGAFSHTSGIVRAMGINFIFSHTQLAYEPRDFHAIRNWYLSCPEAREYFLALEDEFPGFGYVQAQIEEGSKRNAALANAQNATAGKELDPNYADGQKTHKLLEVRNMDQREDSVQKTKDDTKKRFRLRRAMSEKSTSSIETAIWRPIKPTETGAQEIGDEEDDGYTSDNGHMSIKLSKSTQTKPRTPNLSKPLETDTLIQRLLALGGK